MNLKEITVKIKKQSGLTRDEEIISKNIKYIGEYIREIKKNLGDISSNDMVSSGFSMGPSLTLGNKKIQFENEEKIIKVLYTDANKNTYNQVIDILVVSDNNARLESTQQGRIFSEKFLREYIKKII